MDPNENLDPNLNGENVETPATPPVETITPGDNGESANLDGAGNLSPEEVAWSNLKGGTQERIKDILRERDEYRARVERLESLVQTPTYAPSTSTPSTSTAIPGAQDAVARLSEIGIATKDGVEAVVNQKLGGLIYQMELDKLESRYSGDNGLPKFDRSEYEDYINRHPQFRNYTPEDVYEKMYAEEIFDWKLQNQGRTAAQPKQSTTSLRPTKTTVREEPLTVESIEARLRQPDGPTWYDKNKERINAVLASMAPEN